VTGSGFCLVGNFCIDLVIRGVPRLPAWGQEVAGEDFAVLASGQTTYSALALRAMGAPVAVVGCVGEDPWGDRIREELRSRGVDTRALETAPGGRTALTVAAVRPDGERAFISEFACLKTTDASLLERHWERMAGAVLVGLLGVFSWPGLELEQAAEVFGRLRRSGRTTMLDTGWDPGGWRPRTLSGLRALLRETRIFMPNLDEARAITGRGDAEEAAQAIAAMGPELVVVKQGAQGSLALHDGQLVRQPALPAAVVDAVGAGDVFNAGFLLAWTEGRPLPDCLRFGTAAAALYIARPFDRFPAAAEVEERSLRRFPKEGT
jgi:sugar/nucleoside kinase (ribokinase family)